MGQAFLLSQLPDEAAEAQIREVTSPKVLCLVERAQSRVPVLSSSPGRQRLYLTMLLKGSSHPKHIYRKGNIVTSCSTGWQEESTLTWKVTFPTPPQVRIKGATL